MENINLLIVFIEGLLSFFSPCILPILPIYLSMLGNSNVSELKREKFYNNSLIRNTIFFTLGISTTFFILGVSINSLSSYINEFKDIIMIIGGLVIIIMGLFYIDIIKLNILQREKRFKLNVENMNIFSAYLLGFTFSFSWTPCIGPMLTSVLIMSSTSDSALVSNMLIGLYTLGFILPFIIMSVFYNKLFKSIDKLKTHLGTIKKIGGVILIITGLIMSINGFKEMNINKGEKPNKPSTSQGSTNSGTTNEEVTVAPDFTLYDQYNNEHKLSDYKGKTVFLNFWATWCPPCKAEMPHIEEIYAEYGYNKDEVIILGVAMPNVGKEGSKEDITKFLEENDYSFPTVFDESQELMYTYGISSFPTTFIINTEGNIEGYVPGAMDKETMKYIISEGR